MFLFWERLRDRFKPPMLALALMVLMNLLSCAYAVSGKFALNELLKVMTAFCLALRFFPPPLFWVPFSPTPRRSAPEAWEKEGAALTEVAKETGADLTIKSPVAVITIPNAVLANEFTRCWWRLCCRQRRRWRPEW